MSYCGITRVIERLQELLWVGLHELLGDYMSYWEITWVFGGLYEPLGKNMSLRITRAFGGLHVLLEIIWAIGELHELLGDYKSYWGVTWAIGELHELLGDYMSYWGLHELLGITWAIGDYMSYCGITWPIVWGIIGGGGGMITWFWAAREIWYGLTRSRQQDRGVHE